MNKNALKYLGTIFAVAAILLSVHLFNISLIKSGALARSAANQRASGQSIKEWRGCIYDYNMIPLTDRKTANVAAITGESVEVFSRYDQSSVAKHLLGYNLGDGTGAAGLERCFDTVLQSTTDHGIRYITDATGNPINKVMGQSNSTYIAPSNIRLTLDYKIQKIAENAAEKMLDSGAIVILDTSTFDIKAMVSAPGYDQNNVVQSFDQDNSPLVNKAICPYNAGSIFKIITAATAIESNTLLKKPVKCTGETIIDGKKFVCHKDDGHGEMDFADGFANSCNCYFYVLAQNSGAQNVISTAREFGLGESICGDMLNDSTGTLPLRDKYSNRECANIAIGQGELLITPLQATYMTAVVANGGIAKKVNIADSIVDENGDIIKNLRKSGTDIVINADTAQRIASMMRLCVTDGTARDVQNGEVAIAGKTGTAQTGWISNGLPMVHGWFCGFFPYENPRYAMTVFYENGQSGSAACIPIFKEIVMEINKLYN